MNKIFRLRANVVFEAESLDDALLKLKQYFGRMQKRKSSHLFLTGSEMRLEADESVELPPLKVEVEEKPIGVKHGLV